MRRIVSVLIIIGLLAVFGYSGCDKNDENTVNSLPKYHDIFPVFHLKTDNGYRTYGVGSVLLTVDPDIGWLDSVFTDANGCIATMAAGTYITDIDTTIETDPDTQLPDTTVDTISITFGFAPSQEYTFAFERESAFAWVDSFKAVYAVTVDSTWMVVSAETLEVSVIHDTARPLKTVLDSLAVIDNPDDTIGNQPDSIYDLELLYGYWFDTAFVVVNPDDTVDFPPDSTVVDTQLWGFWNRIDSFFLATDSSEWCDIAIDTIIEDDETTYVEQIEIVIDTQKADLNGYVTYIIDTIYHYAECPDYPAVQDAIYDSSAWSNYDTTIHAVFPDTAKSLIFGDSILVVNHVTNDTNRASLYLDDGGDNLIPLSNLQIQLTMPPEEVYPFYDIYIKDE
jgi:hypothetical protein